MKSLTIFTLFMVASLLCHAEPRWCAFSESVSSNHILYPPIARAARIQGVVVMRLTYTLNGKVLETEPVFGPVMLSDALAKQTHTWTIQTDAAGNEPCVTLMVVDFRFHDPDVRLQSMLFQQPAPGVFRASVEEEVLIISDPGADISTNPFRILAYKIKRLTRRTFSGRIHSSL